MTKYDFEDWLRHRLSDLPPEELDRIAAFYRDAIDDRMEDGMTEEEAIYDLGEPEALLEGIRASLPGPVTYRPVHKGTKPARRTGRWVALGLAALVLAAILPVWFLSVNFSGHTATEYVAEHVYPIPSVEAPLAEEDRIIQASCDAGALEKISVEAELGGILVEPSADDAVHILGSSTSYEAVRRGSTLYIENVTDDLTLQLPTEYFSLRLDIQCDLSDVEIYEIVPYSLAVQCDLGNIYLHNVSAETAISLEADCGSIEGSLRHRREDYNIEVDVDLGESNLSDHIQVGEEAVNLTVTADLGNVKIDFED